MLLTLAEGKESFSQDDISEITRRLVLFTYIASMQRSDTVKANYDKFSFIEPFETKDLYFV
jgi:hypothetical protein